MTETNPISKLERRAIAGLWLLVFMFFASFFVSDFVREYNERVADEQLELQDKANNDGRVRPTIRLTRGAPVPAGLHLITLLIFVSLIAPKRFYLCTALTILYGCLIVTALFLRVAAGEPLPDETFGLGLFVNLIVVTRIWDVVGLTVTLGTLIWLGTIHLRLRTNLQ